MHGAGCGGGWEALVVNHSIAGLDSLGKKAGKGSREREEGKEEGKKRGEGWMKGHRESVVSVNDELSNLYIRSKLLRRGLLKTGGDDWGAYNFG